MWPATLPRRVPGTSQQCTCWVADAKRFDWGAAVLGLTPVPLAVVPGREWAKGDRISAGVRRVRPPDIALTVMAGQVGQCENSRRFWSRLIFADASYCHGERRSQQRSNHDPIALYASCVTTGLGSIGIRICAWADAISLFAVTIRLGARSITALRG